MYLSNEYSQEDEEDLKEKTTKFHNALFEIPIDINAIIDIICATNNEKRQLIRGYYKSTYGHPIQEDIKAKLEDRLQELAIDVFDSPYEYDARELHKALKTLTIDDNVIIEIFASRPKDYLLIVDEAYKNFYNISLTDEIKKYIGGDFAKFLLAMMEVKRETEQTISGTEAYQTAEYLIKEGLESVSTNVNKFKEIFVKKSREDLILISRAYNEKSGKSLYDAIDSEVEENNKLLLKAIIFAVITPAEWFAKKILEAIQGISGDSNTIRRILITRSEIDMYAIRDYYMMETGNEIKTDIHDENEDAYEQILGNFSSK